MLLGVFFVLVFAAVFASVMLGGLWSNTVTLINFMLAGLIATNYFEPFADYLDRTAPSFTYAWDFVAIWLVFGLAMAVLRAATDYLSRVKVRFFMPVERAGGIIMAIWVSWLAVCFTAATMHTAPLARHFLGGDFQTTPDAKMFFGLAPDRMWLAWMYKETSGPLSRFGKPRPFDGKGEFIVKYSNRRGEFEDQVTFMKGEKSGGTVNTATPAS
jgi:hypothetical protein